jgi:negative regulator of flagellin synthesis FlgM
MIDGIGKAGAGRLELVRGSTDRGAAVERVEGGTVASSTWAPSSPVAQMASLGAPVDAGKVAAIRAAIAEGRYPVDPAKIAASIVALDLPAKPGA